MGRRKKPLSMASRLAWKLVFLSAFTLTLASPLHFLPSPAEAELRRRTAISESLAITSSLLAQRQQYAAIEDNFTATVSRFPEIVSACIRRHDGTVLQQIGDHQRHWRLEAGASSTADNIYVPIRNGRLLWATVELSFQSEQGWLAGLRERPLLLLGLFTVVVNWLLFRWLLSRAFKYLDPTRSVPMHVRSTLDTFSEGVIVLDNDQRIVLANDKFKHHTGASDQELLGQSVDQLPWLPGDDTSTDGWPESGECNGLRLGLQVGPEHRTYLVNARSILGDDGKKRGTIATFDDITALEQKREQLSRALTELHASRDELTRRNQELQYLATRDSLTACLNRRTFFELFEKRWDGARRQRQPLSCFMVDVDHFKSVNDNHGHSTGDEVLRRVAAVIRKTVNEAGVVCRYGGEEFCVLLPQAKTEAACRKAEAIRVAIERLNFEKLSVTASIGVSSIGLGASDPQQLLDQADQCLYIAKRSGRNRVVRWDVESTGVLGNATSGEPADHPIPQAAYGVRPQGRLPKDWQPPVYGK